MKKVEKEKGREMMKENKAGNTAEKQANYRRNHGQAEPRTDGRTHPSSRLKKHEKALPYD